LNGFVFMSCQLRIPERLENAFVSDAADPCEFGGIEALALSAAEQPLHRQSAIEGADDGAVLGREIVDVIGGFDRPGPGHVLRYDRGIAGDVLAHVARKHAGIEIVTAARREADQDLHDPSFVEIRRRCRVGGQRDGRCQQRGGGREQNTFPHASIRSWRSIVRLPSSCALAR